MGPVQQERVMGLLLLVPGLAMLAVAFVTDDADAGDEPTGFAVAFVLAALFVIRSILRARHRLIVEVPPDRSRRQFLLRRVLPALVLLVVLVVLQGAADGESLGLLGVIYAGFGIAALGRGSVLAH